MVKWWIRQWLCVCVHTLFGAWEKTEKWQRNEEWQTELYPNEVASHLSTVYFEHSKILNRAVLLKSVRSWHFSAENFQWLCVSHWVKVSLHSRLSEKMCSFVTLLTSCLSLLHICEHASESSSNALSCSCLPSHGCCLDIGTRGHLHHICVIFAWLLASLHLSWPIMLNKSLLFLHLCVFIWVFFRDI